MPDFARKYPRLEKKTEYQKEKEDVERAKELINEMKDCIKTRNTWLIRQKLRDLDDILLNVKEEPKAVEKSEGENGVPEG